MPRKEVNNTRCCVPGCRSKKQPSISFHTFPKKKAFVYLENKFGVKEKVDRHKAWLIKLKMEARVSLRAVVCSLHFVKDDYILPDCPTQRRRLKLTAVPSLNLPKSRNIYKKETKIKYMCRICLTQSNTSMFKLTDELKRTTSNAKTYLEALEKITFSRVDINGHYPEGVCPLCVSFLNIAVDFVSQFEMSQKKLQKMFKSNIPAYESIKLEYNSNDEEEDYITEEIKYDPDDPSNVKLIITHKKLNLNEVLVAEKHEKENHDCKSFLKNASKKISASTVTRNKKSKETSFKDNNSIRYFENCEENEDIHNKYDANETEGEEKNIEFIIEPPDDISTKIEDIKEEVEIEDNFNESNSQNNYIMENIQFLEMDMFDKDTKSLIIDRTKLSDDEKETFDTPPQRKRRKKEQEKDAFLKKIKFPCEICKNVYQTRQSLKVHIRWAHNTFYNEQSSL